ncbi:MAG TPA: 1-(5-phosphoribosyl)-5-[(5-phosphoribosylamino)methylideneamino] imidazole-4-carboxamide isomerase [Steroidobacteraceae bacterium]|nr:1-(5-phosphoribosyl)-5-[(5-phosphoribosylamino)methylideneamino] imidazole-4-carboxamide isomerase [Steroidobacteraceae bacterium]
MLLIPAIDLRAGRCVRLHQGDFGAETRYALEPHEILERYRALGAAWLHIVDLDGARDGVQANHATVTALAAERSVKLQAGGGVRSAETAQGLLREGIARVVIGSAALERPRDTAQWLERFGPERIALAFDVRLDERGEPRVHTRGWTRGGSVSLWAAIEPFLAFGLQHVLCTDIERDGTLGGPNLELYREALRRYPHLAWQASGGIRDARDLAALAALGVAAAVSGKALLEERINPQELRPFLPNASFPVSTCAPGRS